MSNRPSAARAGASLGALAAVAATFVLVALVVGSLEFSVVWGLGGVLDLPSGVLQGGLLAGAVVALVIGAQAARRSWFAERQEFSASGPAADDAPPAA
ncbi:MAG: hypothetical protein WD100_08670 [Tistlia sp.]